jgi:zinc/manganese transport system permease protein
MVVGIMMLPAAAARFWSETVPGQMVVATVFGFVACLTGLLVSYHESLPASPSIILAAGVLYGLSVLLGRQGSLAAGLIRLRHLQR